tara:strand:+ start:421 stop:567 length:147 start_codon:yes stop_codon:yes gene_type:complete
MDLSYDKIKKLYKKGKYKFSAVDSTGHVFADIKDTLTQVGMRRRELLH